MKVQFISDDKGRRTAAIVPYDEWERTEATKEVLEHLYLDGIIKERRNKKATVNLDDLLMAEGMPTWKVELIPEAQNDFNSLDGIALR